MVARNAVLIKNRSYITAERNFGSGRRQTRGNSKYTRNTKGEHVSLESIKNCPGRCFRVQGVKFSSPVRQSSTALQTLTFTNPGTMLYSHQFCSCSEGEVRHDSIQSLPIHACALYVCWTPHSNTFTGASSCHRRSIRYCFRSYRRRGCRRSGQNYRN